RTRGSRSSGSGRGSACRKIWRRRAGARSSAGSSRHERRRRDEGGRSGGGIEGGGRGAGASVPSIRAIAVASGKGGVGKTNVVANLAVALRRRGKRVIVIDADLGLANLDTLLGLNPRATIRHVLSGECTIQDVLVEGPAGIQI